MSTVLSHRLPPRRHALLLVAVLAIWLLVTGLFIGFRPEHPALAILILALFMADARTRRIIVALAPFFIFGISYDWMNLLPNYKVNPVDIQSLYDTEKSLFGITVGEASVLTPNEFFALHNAPWMDLLAGFFYLCWVPVPVAFGLWLYYKGQRRIYLHFSLVFLLVNLIGFAGYYVHPAAPPWYVASHGFSFIEGTPGEVAGLGRFDAITSLGIFNGLYARNANVFAAMPSLHSAYMLVAFIYSLRADCPGWMRVTWAVICLGIWLTAVYTSHHYILDVIAGIAVTFAGYLLFEKVLMRLNGFARWIDRYTAYISSDRQTPAL